MSDSLVISLDSQGFQNLFAFRALEFLFRPVDPAASYSKGVGCQHQIPHHKASVIKIVGAASVRQHDQNYRSAVEGIAVHSHDRRIHPGKTVPHFFIRHSNDYGRLAVHSCGRISSGLNDLVDDLLRNHVRFVFPDTPSRLNGFQYFVFTAHNCYLRSFFVRVICFAFILYLRVLSINCFFLSGPAAFHLTPCCSSLKKSVSCETKTPEEEIFSPSGVCGITSFF